MSALNMKARVIFEPEVYKKIKYLVDKAPGEISGLGTVEVLENGDFLVKSAILCKQVNTGSSTDLDENDVNKAMFELRDEPGEMRFWWHSHVEMPVFWSGTDTDTIEKLGTHGVFVSTVFNKKREWRTCIYQKVPYRIFVDEVETKLLSSEPEVVEAWDKEFEEKCKVKSYAPIGINGNQSNLFPVRSENWNERSSAGQINYDSTDVLQRVFKSVPTWMTPEWIEGGYIYLQDRTRMELDQFGELYQIDFSQGDGLLAKKELEFMGEYEGSYGYN